MNDRFRFRVWNGRINNWANIYICDNYVAGFDANKPTGETKLTVMQCTGLKDKNGKLIYEGDIVKHNSGYTDSIDTFCKVVWRDFGWELLREESGYVWRRGMQYASVEMEVVGNIYEHPELLK
jgi:uncharacterized phage protein (TIGR01671 family)